MTVREPHIARHVKRAHEHMSAAQREARRIQDLAADYLADQAQDGAGEPTTTTTEGGASFQSQETASTPASNSALTTDTPDTGTLSETGTPEISGLASGSSDESTSGY